MPRAEILSHQVILKQPGRYIGWPTIAVATNGELLVAFSGDRDYHVDPFGKTQLVRSSDNGRTWSAVETINDTPLDDRDAGLVTLADGSLLVSWFTFEVDLARYAWLPAEDRGRWEKKLASITPLDRQMWLTPFSIDGNGTRGHFIRRSTDNGRTWGPAVRTASTAPHGPTVLRDGRLIYVGNENYDRKFKSSVVVAEESTDHGATWRVVGVVPMFPREDLAEGEFAYLAEPHVVEAADGRLVAMLRCEVQPYVEGRRASVLWQSDSFDGGKTWTDPRRTPILGKPPHLLRLRDGKLLVTYGYRHEPFGQRACVSNDHGQTWDDANEFVLRDDAPNNDLGYPASAQLADGSIFTVYYQIDQPGEKTLLMATHWRLPPRPS